MTSSYVHRNQGGSSFMQIEDTIPAQPMNQNFMLSSYTLSTQLASDSFLYHKQQSTQKPAQSKYAPFLNYEEYMFEEDKQIKDVVAIYSRQIFDYLREEENKHTVSPNYI